MWIYRIERWIDCTAGQLGRSKSLREGVLGTSASVTGIIAGSWLASSGRQHQLLGYWLTGAVLVGIVLNLPMLRFHYRNRQRAR